jgi:DUF1680 family protein
MLVGQKSAHKHDNTCCEGQGTRIVGSLPEYIYSVADDGIYLNLFVSSSIEWRQALRLEMKTEFPYSPNVCLRLNAAKPVRAKIRIRTPSWAAGAMEIKVNGAHAALGTPGRYVTLDRQWSQGDTATFILPMDFQFTQYTGVDRIEGRKRYALEYGPLLMAALDSAAAELEAPSIHELRAALEPVPERPLHFSAARTMWMPYFEVEAQSFSCFPIIECAACEVVKDAGREDSGARR